MVALSLVASNGFPPALQGHVSPRTVQDLQPLFSTTGSRPEIVRSTVLSLTPYEHDDLFRSTTEFNEYCKVVKTASIRRIPLSGNAQEFPHSVLFSSSMDERWAMYQQIVQMPLPRLYGLKEESLEHCTLPDLMHLLLKPDLHLQHIASTDFEFNRFFVEKASLIQGADCDILHHLPSNISVHRDGQLPFIDNMVDITDQASVFAEQILIKDVYLWEQQKMLVPHFRWKDAIDLQDHLCPSSLDLEAVISAPLKSPEKAKPKQYRMRKNKKTARARDVYKTNTLHPCETLLSIMMDNTRNRKSMLSSVKKSGPELPQFLTQFSASIAGTGLAVIFSVLHKAASGTAPFCPSSFIATSGFGIALFWLSWAVNRLRSTIVYIGKNSAKKGFLDEEEEMVRRVDKSVKDILFRAAASMAILMLRFA